MSSQWQQFVQLYREKNPRASMNQMKQTFDKLKKIYSQKGGFTNIDLADANLRYAAGVTPLNSGIAELATLHKGGNGNIDLSDPTLRYAAGVTPLNSGIAELATLQKGGKRKQKKQRRGITIAEIIRRIEECNHSIKIMHFPCGVNIDYTVPGNKTTKNISGVVSGDSINITDVNATFEFVMDNSKKHITVNINRRTNKIKIGQDENVIIKEIMFY